MNIVLIGYRGTGKTLVGQLLSKELDFPLISFDEKIAESEGQPILEIVDQKGWEYFRDIESRVTSDYSKQDQVILDTGGGCILRNENVENLKQNGKLYWLKASVSMITERIQNCQERPSLTGSKSAISEIEEVLLERIPFYQKTADFQIETDGKSMTQVKEEILNIYKSIET